MYSNLSRIPFVFRGDWWSDWSWIKLISCILTHLITCNKWSSSIHYIEELTGKQLTECGLKKCETLFWNIGDEDLALLHKQKGVAICSVLGRWAFVHITYKCGRSWGGDKRYLLDALVQRGALCSYKCSNFQSCRL